MCVCVPQKDSARLGEIWRRRDGCSVSQLHTWPSTLWMERWDSMQACMGTCKPPSLKLTRSLSEVLWARLCYRFCLFWSDVVMCNTFEQDCADGRHVGVLTWDHLLHRHHLLYGSCLGDIHLWISMMLVTHTFEPLF